LAEYYRYFSDKHLNLPRPFNTWRYHGEKFIFHIESRVVVSRTPISEIEKENIMKKTQRLKIFAFSLGLSACANFHDTAEACDWPAGVKAPQERISAIIEVCNLSNIERAKVGATQLVLDSKIVTVAQSFAEDMEQRNYFSHTNPEGQSVADRLKQNQVVWTSAGENIALGQQSPRDVMYDWMSSPGHRQNLLNKSYTKIGIGLENWRWVQNFTN